MIAILKFLFMRKHSYQAIQKYYRGESIFIESFPEIELTLIEILGNIC